MKYYTYSERKNLNPNDEFITRTIDENELFRKLSYFSNHPIYEQDGEFRHSDKIVNISDAHFGKLTAFWKEM